ncbi:MAG: outer membrane protein [Croceibacterium sp.]
MHDAANGRCGPSRRSLRPSAGSCARKHPRRNRPRAQSAACERNRNEKYSRTGSRGCRPHRRACDGSGRWLDRRLLCRGSGGLPRSACEVGRRTASAKADSAVYGVDAGYDIGLGSAFVGVEGEVSTSGGSTKFPGSTANAYDSLKANGQYYVGARAGVALTPGIAAYGKVGYTSLNTRAFTSSGSLSELKNNTSGVRFGGGLQVKLPGPLVGKVEYRRSRYKDVNSGTYGDVNTDQVVAGVGVHF